MDDKKTTTEIVQNILSKQIQHSFSIALDREHADKRYCLLSGPILQIVDPNRLKPNLYVFLPDWNLSSRKSKGHRTIVLEFKKPDEQKIIKMKSKNIKTVDGWLKRMMKAVDELSLVKIRFANHHARVNKDGTFLQCTVQMSNDAVRIIVNEKVHLDVPRFPESRCFPNLNDFSKVHIYRENHMVATIKCKSNEQANKMLVELNVLPEDLKTIPSTFLETTTIPDISDSAFDEMSSGSSLASSSSQFLDAVLAVGGEEEEEEEEENLPGNIDDNNDENATNKKNNSSTKTNNGKVAFQIPNSNRNANKNGKKKRKNTVSGISFDILMEQRMEKINDLPRNDKHPDSSEIAVEITKKFDIYKSSKKTPIINVEKYSSQDDVPPFEFPDLPFLKEIKRYTSEDEKVKLKRLEAHTINTEYYPTKVFESLPEEIQNKLKEMKFVPLETTVNNFSIFMEQLKNTAEIDLPAVATGIFLNGRKYTCEKMAEKLIDLHFSIDGIRKPLRKYKIKDQYDFYTFFSTIYSRNLASFFFEALYNQPHFRKNNYYPDAIMQVDGICKNLSHASSKENSQPLTKQYPKRPNIPYETFCSPHVTLAEMVPIFQSKYKLTWIKQNSYETPSEFSMIIAAVIMPIGSTLNDKALYDVLYNGKYDITYDVFLSSSRRLDESIKGYIDRRKNASKHEKIIRTLITLIVNNQLVTALLNFASEANVPSKNLQEWVLCINELLKLNTSFTPECLKTKSLYSDVKNDLDKILNRNPVIAPKEIDDTAQSTEIPTDTETKDVKNS
ncbi:hypothetical protein TRFO_31769 [Tritrichomonas foetus]|uniref:Uncharacterized protein n=1 Tax=Tritrichomonas foetus TaxID=1144522 RepID=A0A1J4JRR6_9EUKA|nr:hypothetical protein TRFO_31769 [Tritrichomonas foetus]|eukprot:OHT01442.1 hypothetical protein TRFO_31769 [Tritrichomonas foetus]